MHAASRQHSRPPIKFVPITLTISSGPRSTNRARPPDCPALFTQQSTRPRTRDAYAEREATDAGSLTSAAIPKARAGEDERLLRATTAEATSETVRAQITTLSPLERNSAARAKPTPRLPPVMTTFRGDVEAEVGIRVRVAGEGSGRLECRGREGGGWGLLDGEVDVNASLRAEGAKGIGNRKHRDGILKYI